MSKEPSAAEMIRDFAPKLVDLTDRVFSAMYGNAWSSPNVIAVLQPWLR